MVGSLEKEVLILFAYYVIFFKSPELIYDMVRLDYYSCGKNEETKISESW